VCELRTPRWWMVDGDQVCLTRYAWSSLDRYQSDPVLLDTRIYFSLVLGSTNPLKGLALGLTPRGVETVEWVEQE